MTSPRNAASQAASQAACPSQDDLPRLIDGIGGLASDYDGFILDIWGVLHDGLHPYEGVIDGLNRLKAAGKEILLLSNSPNRAEEVSGGKLREMGFVQGVHYDHIVTSGEATWQAMAAYEGQSAYVFWPEETPTALEGRNIQVVHDIALADFILGSLFPAGAQAEDYAQILMDARGRNLPFICANPDKVVNIGPDLHICAGALADMYEEMGGKVVWFGKPHAPVYEQAFGQFQTVSDKSRLLAVGDSLRTDVTGANNFGIDVLWNVVGIHWEELRGSNTQGGIDSGALDRTLNRYGVRPLALLHGLKW